MYYKLMPFWTTTTKKSFSCYKNNPSSILLSPLSRQLSGFSTSNYPKHKLCSQNKTKKAAFCVKKKHFGTNNVAGFSNSFQTNSIFHYNRNFFDPGMENILSQGWKTFFHRDGKLVLILIFSLFFHFSKRERGEKPLDWFTKSVMNIFTFVNRIATELVK